MANWARGLAAGLESGYKLGEVLRQKQIRDAMTEARTQAESGGYNRFSQQDINKLNEYATAVDPEGRRMFDLTIEPGTTTYVPRRIVYGNEAPQIEGYSPAWLGRETGLAPQQGAEVSASPVPMDFLPAEQRLLDTTGGEPYFPGAMNSLDEPGVRVGKEGLRPSVGNYPSMGTEAASIAPQAYEGLTTSAPEYSPDLRISRPDDSAAYRSLTRETVPEAGLGPTRTVFMGKEYEAGTLTKEMRDAALMDRYASILERAGEPDRAMQMRASAMGLRKGQLELENAERTAAKQRTLSEIDTGAKDFWKSRVGDREPKFEDNLALTQWRAGKLIEAGMVDEAEALGDKMMARVSARLNNEKAERDVRLPAAIMAARSGDLKPITEVYNKFVHDGANVEKVTTNPDGTITVHRRAISGADLPDYTFNSMQEFTRSLEDLLKPGRFEDYTQQSFMNNLRTQESKRQDKELKLKETQVGYEGQRVGLAARRAAAADTIPVIDKQGNIGLMRTDNIKYDERGMAVFPEGVQPYRGSGQIGQGALSSEQERALADIRSSDDHKADMRIITQNKDPERVAAAKERVRRRLEMNKLPVDALDLGDRDLIPMD